MGFLPGEKEAILQAVAIGHKYGFGNLIAHLRRAWAMMLRDKYGIPYDNGVEATNVDAYPEHFPLEVDTREGEAEQ